MRYFLKSLLICCLTGVLCIACDANSDEEGPLAFLNIGLYEEEVFFSNTSPVPVGQLSFPVDKAINLSRFPSTSVRIPNARGWQKNISGIPENLESTLFFFQVLEGQKDAGSIWDARPDFSSSKNNQETPGDSLTITFYGFFIERPGITYPEALNVDLLIARKHSASLEIVPSEHTISLDDITFKTGADLGQFSGEPGLMFDFGSEVLDASLRPVLISRRLERGVFGARFNHVGAFWGDPGEFPGQEYGRAAILSAGIRQDSEFLFFVMKKDA